MPNCLISVWRARENTMGWWCVAPGKWLLFYDPGGPFPKRPGARWVPDDDPSIGWKKPKPIYLSHTVDEHKLATNIAAVRSIIRGFEYMIATDPKPRALEEAKRARAPYRFLRLEHDVKIIDRPSFSLDVMPRWQYEDYMQESVKFRRYSAACWYHEYFPRLGGRAVHSSHADYEGDDEGEY